jgi:4-hydroxybenzoate polyprenyltransferase
MAANDWADRDIDARERPERPIPSGRVTPGTALGVAAGLSAAGLTLAALAGGRRALAVAMPLAGAVWWYDMTLKATMAGPAAMAACRGLDVLLGASAGNWRRATVPALTVAAHTYTVTALSRREVTGGSPLLPGATLVGTTAVAAAAAAPTAGSRGSHARLRRLLPTWLAACYAASYGTAQVRAIAEPDAGRMRTAVRAGITNLPALQGALIARSGAPATGAAVAAAAPVGRALARWRSPT